MYPSEGQSLAIQCSAALPPRQLLDPAESMCKQWLKELEFRVLRLQINFLGKKPQTTQQSDGKGIFVWAKE